MAHGGATAFVWPSHDWPLSTLTAAQRASWDRDGYLVVPNAVNASVAAAAANAVRAFVGADPDDPATWYSNTLDIYSDRTPSGKKPHHGPCGMVQFNHHRALWNLRQEPRIHGAFADLYGTRRLYVTADRAHFKPPQRPEFPAWSDPGEVHVGLHWDVDTRCAHGRRALARWLRWLGVCWPKGRSRARSCRDAAPHARALPVRRRAPLLACAPATRARPRVLRRGSWPVPYVIQGVVYLEATSAAQGALRVVPGFHRQLAAWDSTQPASRSSERPEGAAGRALLEEAVAVEGGAGSLVLWHSLLPHGPAPNVGSLPRISAYVAMLPVDAAPFLGGRPADTPLS
eukprot:7382851-Prymnesium_polylepis.1